MTFVLFSEKLNRTLLGGGGSIPGTGYLGIFLPKIELRFFVILPIT
jgi:hypothetical protein